MEQSFNGIKYKFFLDGIFSNWWRCNFVVNDIKYNCVEQYMMHQKALCFNDIVCAESIMNTTIPSLQKRLGREVINFNAEKWDSVKYNIVKVGVKAKFVQNKELKQYLLSYNGFQIIEASPDDRIWGIGYSDNEAIANIDNWGENLLGKILTSLTLELR